MKKAKKKKIAKYIALAIASIYLLLLIISGVFMASMMSVTYESSFIGVTVEHYKIDFKANTTDRSYYNVDGTPRAYYSNELTAGQEIKLKTICIVSLMPLWRRNYNNPFIMDGDQWDVIRNYGKFKHETYGSNAYPLTYRWVLWAIADTMKK